VPNPLEFWLGRWDVTSREGEFAGRNRIEEVLDGNAVLEHWDSEYGDGKSLFYAHAPSGEWRQVWIMANGSVKEKRMVDAPEGEVRFQGTVVREGRELLDRTTLTPQDDGSVRQLIEASDDGGEHWTPTFDGIYRRTG
jgi:hypothetical protein